MSAFETAPEDASLRETVACTIKKGVIGHCSAACTGWMVLVLDSVSTRVVTPVLGMYDLMEERVTLVESLEKKRQPFPEMEVVYIVSPTAESVAQICQDFDAGRAQCMYGDVHIFFLSPLPDAQMAVLGKCSQLVQRIKTLKELNLAFLAVESQVFHLDMPRTFSRLSPGSSAEACQIIAERLATVCITLNEYPLIRIKSDNSMMSQLAQAMQVQPTRAVREMIRDCAVILQPCVPRAECDGTVHCEEPGLVVSWTDGEEIQQKPRHAAPA